LIELTDKDTGRGYVWQSNGQQREIPLPIVNGVRANGFWPESVHGDVVDGRAVMDSQDGNTRTFVQMLFNLRTNAFTVLPQKMGLAVGNRQGWLAGLDTGGVALTRPVGDGNDIERIPLLGLVPLTGDKMQDRVNAPSVVVLSEDGRVLAGQADDATGQPQAVIWHCS
jgi:hypothetical protein